MGGISTLSFESADKKVCVKRYLAIMTMLCLCGLLSIILVLNSAKNKWKDYFKGPLCTCCV